MVGVAGGTVAEYLRVHGCSPGKSAVELLEHYNARALTHHEPCPCRVEGPRGPCRFFVFGNEAAHGAEAAEEQRVDARLGTPCQHYVGGLAADELGSQTDCMCTGGTRRDNCVVRAADPERDRDLAAGRVGQNVGQEGRGNVGWTALSEDVVLASELAEAADARAQDDADTVRPVAVDSRVGERLPRRRQREEDAAPELPSWRLERLPHRSPSPGRRCEQGIRWCRNR